MKTFCFTLLTGLAGLSAIAQESAGTPASLMARVEKLEIAGDSLRRQYYALQADNDTLESKLLNMYRGAFREMEWQIKEAFDQTDVISISATYQQVIKSIILLHNEITRINNFTDAEKIFGIDFVAAINGVVEKELVQHLCRDSESRSQEWSAQRRERFRTIITSILQNPVITTLVRSNPVTSVAHTIINQALSFSMPSLDEFRISHGSFILPDEYRDFKNDYPAFKKSFETPSLTRLPGIESAPLDESITRFTDALKPYIRLFDELSAINARYSASLEVFMQASEQTIERVLPVEKAFYARLQAANRAEAREVINRYFNIGPEADISLLETRLNQTSMKEVLAYGAEVNESMLLLRNDFLKIITLEIALTEEYILFFSSLKEGRNGMPSFPNTEIIDERIAQFTQLRSSLEKQKDRLEEMSFGN